MKLSVRGASHSRKISFRVDGFPRGVAVDPQGLARFMERRAPGRDALSTSRREPDKVVFVSGVERGFTTGGSIEGEIANTDFRPGDYGAERTVPRPGHADFPQWVEFGRIPTGGGSNSGRMTAALAAAGWLALKFLGERGVSVSSRTVSIGGRKDGFEETILAAKADGDSVGGVVECEVSGLRPGLGGSLFAGVESAVSSIVFAIPGVKGIEFGNGFEAAGLRGSANNDAFRVVDGRVVAATNRHGGVLGGRTSGMPVVFRVAMKPTPTVFIPQRSVDLASMSDAECVSKGRHDPCIALRALPVIEAAAAFALAGIVADDEKEHPRICLVLSGRTLAEDLAIYGKERYFADMVELRADFLSDAERAMVSSFPAMVDVPVVLTFRRRRDGGEFDGSEDERRRFFENALVPGCGFRYVDFEDDFRDGGLSALARGAGATVIRSLHLFDAPPDAPFADTLRRLAGDEGEIPKLAFTPRSFADVERLFREMESFGDMPHIVCAMGKTGFATRVLAAKLGSFLTYASSSLPSGIGHATATGLVRDWRVRAVTKNARVVFTRGEDAFGEAIRLNSGFAVEEEDAVAVPAV
ncbi:MAG: chorismate synthase [Kiritimatiellae bacterium]|nr:chorismate synthase [Kiritimatiellia bacterium]